MSAVAPDDDLAVLAEIQGVLIEVLEARNAELAAQVAELAERLARLERAVSRNSGNSGMPPSADDLPGKTPPAAKPKRGGKKRQGKQPGAPGAHLAWSENPDSREDLFPQGACACGRDLAGADDLGVTASHQVIDTPVVTAAVTQYDGHAVACRCGRVRAAPPPAGAGEAGTVTYGLNLQAWTVFLLVVHHVPVERCAGIIEALTGTRPSDGFVHSMIARAARAVRWACMLIRALVITAGVLCADETPLRVGPGPKTRKKYLLVACTNLLTCYFLGDRSMRTFDAFVFPDLSGTVLVHDRYQNYDAIPGVLHQLCTQHLLRDLEDAAESYPDAIWPGQAAGALRTLIHAANTARDKGLAAAPADVIAADLVLFRNAVRVQTVADPPGARRENQAETRPHAAGMPQRPRGRRAAVPGRPADPADLQPGRARPGDPRKPSRRSPAGSAPRPPPATATPSAATSTPPASTASPPSPPSATPSPETPGCQPSQHNHSHASSHSRNATVNNTATLG